VRARAAGASSRSLDYRIGPLQQRWGDGNTHLALMDEVLANVIAMNRGEADRARFRAQRRARLLKNSLVDTGERSP